MGGQPKVDRTRFAESSTTLSDSSRRCGGMATQGRMFGVGWTCGGAKNPLLVSVRSGSRASMPGMMDTILNLGLNDQSVVALEKVTGNSRFAYDCYRRFIQMYGDVVMGVQKREGEDHDPFEHTIHTFKHEVYHGDIEGMRKDRAVIEAYLGTPDEEMAHA